MSTLKVSNIQDISNNAAMSISGGVTTFNNLPVNASAAGSAAFAARFSGNGWAVMTDGGIIPYNDDSTGDSFDTDGVYNTSTYKFTAPATGVYMFWYSIYTANSASDNAFGFLKNAAKVDMNFDSSGKHFSNVGATSGDHMQEATVVIPLASGDTMAHCATIANTDYYKGFSQWGGCRLA